MRDGATRKMVRQGGGSNGFAERHRATLVVIAGGAEGTEVELEGERMVLGRGPSVDFAVDDAAVSQQHLALELTPEGYRARDLKTTNGTRVNGAAIVCADLKHGDRIELGECAFQYVVELRESGPRAYEVS